MSQSIGDVEANWISGDEYVARQTRSLIKEFGHSKPHPRNRQMGFTGRDERPSNKRPSMEVIYSV